MMSLVLLLLVAVSMNSVESSPLPEDIDADIHQEFEEWKLKYEKTYLSTEEETKRKELWLATRKRVMEHNLKAAKGLEKYTMTMRNYADLSIEDFSPTEEELDKEFTMWKTKHGKTYKSSEEEAERRNIWLTTRKEVMEHNRKAANGMATWIMGLNNFSDLTFEEFFGGGCLIEDKEEDIEFEMWKRKHDKTYDSSEEEAKRKNIWLATRRRVMEHNQKAANGSFGWDMGLNPNSDMSTDELSQRPLFVDLSPPSGENISEVVKEFQEWKVKQGKTYESPEEESKRKGTWLATRAKMMEHNKRAESGLESWTMYLNQFSDRTTEEVTGIQNHE